MPAASPRQLPHAAEYRFGHIVLLTKFRQTAGGSSGTRYDGLRASLTASISAVLHCGIGAGVSLAPISAGGRRLFIAELAAHLCDVPEGSKTIAFRVED